MFLLSNICVFVHNFDYVCFLRIYSSVFSFIVRHLEIQVLFYLILGVFVHFFVVLFCGSYSNISYSCIHINIFSCNRTNSSIHFVLFYLNSCTFLCAIRICIFIHAYFRSYSFFQIRSYLYFYIYINVLCYIYFPILYSQFYFYFLCLLLCLYVQIVYFSQL